MNERIEKLAREAGIAIFGDAVYMPNPKDTLDSAVMEKFAELIVQECITTILKESKWYWDQEEFESSNAIQNAASRVKERFRIRS